MKYSGTLYLSLSCWIKEVLLEMCSEAQGHVLILHWTAGFLMFQSNLNLYQSSGKWTLWFTGWKTEYVRHSSPTFYDVIHSWFLFWLLICTFIQSFFSLRALLLLPTLETWMFPAHCLLTLFPKESHLFSRFQLSILTLKKSYFQITASSFRLTHPNTF